ncbi:hypothetical protein [Mesorhizobium sp. M0130]|uniref:hypothetical protein n=1 Tax=Mesorhizobium sp. M0130 TaxID=2956887 RepID=UPI00333860E5
MYWRIEENARDYCILVDDGNTNGSQAFLEMEEAGPIDKSKLLFRFDDERPLPIPDFVPGSHPGVLFAKREIFEAFGPIVSRSKHLLYTAKTDRGDLKIYVPMEEISGFDFSKSIFETFEDGDIYRIDQLRLVDDFSTEFDIFRLNDNFGTRFHIIVSDKFKYIYDSQGMTGLRFSAT